MYFLENDLITHHPFYTHKTNTSHLTAFGNTFVQTLCAAGANAFFKYCSSRFVSYICVILPNDCKIACPRENKYYFKIENCVAIPTFMPLACVCNVYVCVRFFVVREFSVSLIRMLALARSLAHQQTNQRTDTRTHTKKSCTHREVISRFGYIQTSFF